MVKNTYLLLTLLFCKGFYNIFCLIVLITVGYWVFPMSPVFYVCHLASQWQPYWLGIFTWFHWGNRAFQRLALMFWVAQLVRSRVRIWSHIILNQKLRYWTCLSNKIGCESFFFFNLKDQIIKMISCSLVN